MTLSILTSDVGALAAAVCRRDVSAVEVVTAFLDRAEATNRRYNAFIEIDRDRAVDRAAQVDDRVAQGEAPPLAGVPVGVKDLIVTRGLRSTAGSRALANYVPPYDSTAVARLKRAGAIVIGKTNLDEFGMGSSSERSAFGAVHNPRAPERSAGGSSGGSAAAVAAGMCPAALGTDTGGSVRQPAAFTGTVGLKPTYGRVSRYGLIAYASSLDQIGPIGRSVEDVARLLQVVAGADPRDATSLRHPVPDLVEAARCDRRSLRGLKVGVLEEALAEGTDPEIAAAVRGAALAAERMGATLTPVSLPHTEYAVAAYYVVAMAEASSNLARYDGIKYGFRPDSPATVEALVRGSRTDGFGPEVRRRVLLGTYVLSSGYYGAYYLRAQEARRLIRLDFSAAFEAVDVILGPVTPTLPFPLGEMTQDSLSMYLSDVFTVPASLAGIPAISIPYGQSTGALPIGLQIMAPWLHEQRLISSASALTAVFA